MGNNKKNKLDKIFTSTEIINHELTGVFQNCKWKNSCSERFVYLLRFGFGKS